MVDETDPVVADALAGDQRAFDALCEGFRLQLQLYCYRMVGAFEDSRELAAETLRRAWDGREAARDAGGPACWTFLDWLLKIATETCLEFLRVRREAREAGLRGRPPVPLRPGAAPFAPLDPPWLQPFPDRLLDQAAPGGTGPPVDGPAGQVEPVHLPTIALPFVVALQYLPAGQRATLILREVLGCPPKRVAELLEVPEGAVNKRLHDARTRMRQLLPPRSEPAPQDRVVRHDGAVRQGFLAAAEQNDPTALARLLREDVWQTLPPSGAWLYGRELVVRWWCTMVAGRGSGSSLLLPVGANRQPAVVSYVRPAAGAGYEADGLHVLRVEDQLVAEIATFVGPDLIQEFGVPASLPPGQSTGATEAG